MLEGLITTLLTCSPSALLRVAIEALMAAIVGKEGPVEYIRPRAKLAMYSLIKRSQMTTPGAR